MLATLLACVLMPAPTTAVEVYIMEDCPISRKYVAEINRLVDDYATDRVTFTLVHVDPHTDIVEAGKFAKAFNFKGKSAIDPKHKRAKSAGVTKVPTGALYQNGKLAYLGRIDDRFPELGAQRKAPKRLDLRIAIDQVLAGNPVSVPRTPVVGCVLPTL